MSVKSWLKKLWPWKKPGMFRLFRLPVKTVKILKKTMTTNPLLMTMWLKSEKRPELALST